MKLLQLLVWLNVFQAAFGSRVREGDQAKQSIAFLRRDSRFSVSDEHAKKLCTDSAVKGGSDVLGGSQDGETLLVSPAQLAEVLAASGSEVDALIQTLFGDDFHGSQDLDLQAFCEKAVSHIPSILGMAAPDAPGLGCIDDECAADGIDVSEEALALGDLTSVPSAHGADVNVSTSNGPAEPDSPEDLGRDLFRRALNVLFGIYPAVSELEDEIPGSFLQENAKRKRDANQSVAFGPRTYPVRHDQYRAYAVKASAWIATALRRMRSGKKLVKKWLILGSDDAQIDEQVREARRHLTRMLTSMGRLMIKKGEESGICEQNRNGGTLAYVRVFRNCGVSSKLDCGEKIGGRYVINICEFYWDWTNGDDSMRVGTLVHESSHHFGTVDKGYCGEVNCLSLSSTSARNNADSYTYLVQELVKKSWLAEDRLPTDLMPHVSCNTICNPPFFTGAFGKWYLEGMLPNGSCGECQDVRHMSILGHNVLGKDCDADLTQVTAGIAHKLCCKPHKCTQPSTTSSTSK